MTKKRSQDSGHTLNRKLTHVEELTEPLSGVLVAAAILRGHGNPALTAKLLGVTTKTLTRYRDRFELRTDEQINEKASIAAFSRAMASIQNFYNKVWPGLDAPKTLQVKPANVSAGNAASNRKTDTNTAPAAEPQEATARTVRGHGMQGPSALVAPPAVDPALTPAVGNTDNDGARSAPKAARSLRGSARLSARSQGQPFDTTSRDEAPQRCTLCAQPAPNHLVSCLRHKEE